MICQSCCNSFPWSVSHAVSPFHLCPLCCNSFPWSVHYRTRWSGPTSVWWTLLRQASSPATAPSRSTLVRSGAWSPPTSSCRPQVNLSNTKSRPRCCRCPLRSVVLSGLPLSHLLDLWLELAGDCVGCWRIVWAVWLVGFHVIAVLVFSLKYEKFVLVSWCPSCHACWGYSSAMSRLF